jgi:hypothetical protein
MTTAVCETTERLDNGDVIRCIETATYVVLTPVGRRHACDEHAKRYSASDGFLVRPINDVCDKCGAINVSRKIGTYCWCGSGNGVERINVDGIWYALCLMHRPPVKRGWWKRMFGGKR